jgi:hypothetical protein
MTGALEPPGPDAWDRLPTWPAHHASFATSRLRGNVDRTSAPSSSGSVRPMPIGTDQWSRATLGSDLRLG